LRVDARVFGDQFFFVRISIHLPGGLYREVRTLAERSGRSLEDVIADLTRRGLMLETRGEHADLPIFEVPRGAQSIPGNRVSELLSMEL